MSEIEAKAAVFVTAFRALTKVERDAVMARMTEDRVAAKDLLDWATAFQRRNQPGRTFRSYLAERRTAKTNGRSR